ncbi:unnamed protein product [Diamesa serratosioi]
MFKIDNEEPRTPPVPQKYHNVPKNVPSVPELTIFSPSNKVEEKTTKAGNQFLLRSTRYENYMNTPIVTGENVNRFEQQQSTTIAPKPSVPDVSIFDKPAVHSNSAPNVYNFFQKRNHSSKENITDNIPHSSGAFIPKPAVPDLTILEDKSKNHNSKSSSNGMVFSESYKDMMINSHEKLLKQLNSSSILPSSSTKSSKNTNTKRSTLFNQHQPKYQENPLKKYAPIPTTINYNDGNSSSILIDVDDIRQVPFVPLLTTKPSIEEESDESTLQKVTEMLSEIEKIHINPSVTVNPPPKKPANPFASRKLSNILKSLAQSYLTEEEIEFYDIEHELQEIASHEG